MSAVRPPLPACRLLSRCLIAAGAILSKQLKWIGAKNRRAQMMDEERITLIREYEEERTAIANGGSEVTEAG
jgi:hypothetical protein